MTHPNLDPNPLNELGKGIFPPAEEADLLAQGYIFAFKRHVPGQKPAIVFCCKRSIEDAATDMAISAHRILQRQRETLSVPVTA